MTELEERALRDAYGLFPSGVVAVAARVDDRLTGIAASSFTSISIDPPLVSFSIANSSSTWPTLQRAARLGVSVLAGHHDVLCRQLAGPAEHRFDGLACASTEGGAILLPEAVATFECSMHAQVEAGDHTVVLLRVEELHPGAGAEPLVFHRSGFARLDRSDLNPAPVDGRINGEPVSSKEAVSAA